MTTAPALPRRPVLGRVMSPPLQFLAALCIASIGVPSGHAAGHLNPIVIGDTAARLETEARRMPERELVKITDAAQQVESWDRVWSAILPFSPRPGYANEGVHLLLWSDGHAAQRVAASDTLRGSLADDAPRGVPGDVSPAGERSHHSSVICDGGSEVADRYAGVDNDVTGRGRRASIHNIFCDKPRALTGMEGVDHRLQLPIRYTPGRNGSYRCQTIYEQTYFEQMTIGISVTICVIFGSIFVAFYFVEHFSRVACWLLVCCGLWGAFKTFTHADLVGEAIDNVFTWSDPDPECATKGFFFRESYEASMGMPPTADGPVRAAAVLDTSLISVSIGCPATPMVEPAVVERQSLRPAVRRRAA